MEKIVVSILMGAYNCEKTLESAIDSILKQTYSHWEFIICDDGSIDGTEAILRKYKDNPKFIILKNEKNIGLAATLNKCFEKSSGKYLARQDADDSSVLNRLELLVDFLDKHQVVDVLGSNANLVNHGQDWGKYLTQENPSFLDWAKGTQIIHAAAIFRREIFQKVNGYDPTAIRVEDYDLWMRMLAKGAIFSNLQAALYNIQWNEKDYERKKKSDRLREIVYKFKLIKLNKMPLYCYLMILKPMLLMFFPNKVLYLYHSAKMKK
ncbi:MAG: glycosyltransferase [Bacteriovorax sp.]|nr:glycosyltransferase [Bacteriovorax sp.]